MSWTDVINLDKLPSGEQFPATVKDRPIVLCNVDGDLYAVDDFCTHAGMPLSGGCLDGDAIVCPFHGARFCLKSGKALTPPAFAPVKTYGVRVNEGMIQINLTDE